MGMNIATMPGSGDAETLMDVNTTPLIDVMLVLLVMFIITIPAQLHSIGLNIGPGDKTQARPVVHMVAIDFDGTVYWDNQVLASRAEVDARMQQVGALAEAAQPEVHIKPSKLADYGAFAAVMASAQSHNVKKLGVAGNEQFRS
ncbi:ExbD/TolR family protein [Roseateles sp. NT4]|uniref:ExbD/TolR family protein n=1 Tax=Roseateles sp. NT4 TaxID=3453715 RepID=UPI003EEC7163